MADNEKTMPASAAPAASNDTNSNTTQLSAPIVAYNVVLKQETRDCLEQLTDAQLRDPEYVESAILEFVKVRFDIENGVKDKSNQWTAPKTLIPAQIAMIMQYRYRVACIVTGGDNNDADYDLLGIYQEDGPDAGIYITSEAVIAKMAQKYSFSLNQRESQEVLRLLRQNAERIYPSTDPDLIAVNNGIFDYRTKTLMPFSPDIVFLAKSKVDYNKNAVNIVIHNNEDGTDWDVESWMKDLSDDPEIVELLWEILGAIIRPHVPWNKSAWFYSETGNNGKGTLCELMRQLCGNGSYASLPLSDMGKDFMLEPLTRASAIIVDENDVGTFIDRAANLKAIITGDAIQINRKFKIPIPYRFHGFMVQCLNEMPRIKDKSDSFFRRQLFIPFDKCFTGVERKYIKKNYLHRQEVLEYVLFRVLNMNYYELANPATCQKALEQYREFNDPVLQFASEVMPQFAWSLVPREFLYDLYKSWYTQNIGKSGLPGRNTFYADFQRALKDYPEWQWSNERMRVNRRMDDPELLILEYKLDEWKNKFYNGMDPDRICIVQPQKDRYSGLYRV